MKRWITFLSVLLSLSAPVSSLATVTNTTTETITANGDGLTTNFTIGFYFQSNTQVTVTRLDTSDGSSTSIAQGSGSAKFSITGGDPGTTVVMGTAPTSTQHLVIGRSIPLTQTVQYTQGQAFPVTSLMTELDKITLALQDIDAGTSGGSGGSSGGGGFSSTITIPKGHAHSLLEFDSTGLSVISAPDFGSTLSAGDMLQWDGNVWTNTAMTGAGITALINNAATPITGGAGGTGVSNSGTLTWNHNLQFTTGADTNVTLPSSGTLIAGTTSSSNTAGALVIRDGSGNFSSGTITASIIGNVTGNLTGNVTGNTSGTASNVTGTIAIGHGGTGQTTQAAAMTALAGTQTANYVMESDGVNTALSPLNAAALPTIPWSKMAQQTHNSLLASDNSGNESVITACGSGGILASNGVSYYCTPLASLAGLVSGFPYSPDTGTANTYVVTPGSAQASYVTGYGIAFVAVNANTGAATLNVSGLGAKNLTAPGGSVALVSGDIQANQLVVAVYDGTEFQMASPQGYAVSAEVINQVMKRDAIGGVSVISLYATNSISTSSNPATAGSERLAVGDTVSWRNFQNTGNISLGVQAATNFLQEGSSVIALGPGSGTTAGYIPTWADTSGVNLKYQAIWSIDGSNRLTNGSGMLDAEKFRRSGNSGPYLGMEGTSVGLPALYVTSDASNFNNWTAVMGIKGLVTDIPTLYVQEAASQTSPVQVWENNAGTILAGINSQGGFYTGASVLVTGTATGDELSLASAPASSATKSIIMMAADIASGSGNGTFIGANPTSFSGDFENFQVNGASVMVLSNAGNMSVTGSVRAAKFIGDGSLITGLTATSGTSITWNTYTTSQTIASGGGIIMNCSTPCNVTFPASSSNSGQVYYIKNINATVTFVPNGADKFDGETGQTLYKYSGVVEAADGSGNWYAF